MFGGIVASAGDPILEELSEFGGEGDSGGLLDRDSWAALSSDSYAEGLRGGGGEHVAAGDD